jgi:hypothetical protein
VEDYYKGKFEGIKIGYEQAINNQEDPSPLDLPFFVSAQWKTHQNDSDRQSWEAGFIQGMREGFQEGENVRVIKEERWREAEQSNAEAKKKIIAGSKQ